MLGVFGATEMQQLLKLQNRAARIITGSNYDAPSKPVLEALSWKPIKEMIQFESQFMVFKSINGLAPQYLIDLYEAHYEFLVQFKKYCHRAQNTKESASNGQKSFSYRGARL